MASVTHFTQLVVWRQAHELAILVYRYTATFPPEEKYGLTSQMRRAAISISSNIAEGFKRPTTLDQRRFYRIATASAQELQAQLLLARDLEYLPVELASQLINMSDKTSYLLYRWMGGTKGNTVR
jgi:four helix bundle protein